MQIFYPIAALVTVSTCAVAKPVTFAFFGAGQKGGISLGGITYPLSAPWPADPYFNGTVEVPNNVKTYKYVIDGRPEPFDRVLPISGAKMMNEFYGRAITYQPMPQFRAPFQGPKGKWTRASQAEIFDGGYIPTVHFSGAGAERFITTGKKGSVDVLIVGPTQVHKFRGVSASAKNKSFAKAQLKLDFAGEDFYGRSTIKLRNGETDGTMMREQLYTEMLRATGAPTQSTTKARVYYNNKEYGLLELQDEAFNEGFIKQLFYGNSVKKPRTLGVPLDCSTGADFTPNGPYYSFQQKNEERTETTSRVAALSKALSKLDVSNEAAIAEFDKRWFDIDSFFKAIAMQYLAGHWDGYWMFTTNFVVYDDPLESVNGKFKFYFIDQDFDQTFGVNFGPPYNTAGPQATSQSYKDLLSRKWKLTDLDATNRTMVDKLLKGPSILVPRFERILTGIVKQLFNPDVVKSKLDALSKRYRPEIEWDRQVTRPRKGEAPWTIRDFDTGLKSPIGNDQWGLLQWVEQRASAVAKEFNFQWDKRPLQVLPTLSERLEDSKPSSGQPTMVSGTALSTAMLLVVTLAVSPVVSLLP